MRRLNNSKLQYMYILARKMYIRVCDMFFWDEWFVRSWSQEGEDMVLRRIFEGKKHGYYVDIGAHHPRRFSNTYYFYRKGWTGLNVDAMPDSMNLFKKWRPNDINIETGVAQKSGELSYYIFNEPALNSFSLELSLSRENAANSYHIKEIIKVKVMPLSEILLRYVGNNKIDFLTIDVEGFDLDVIKSNDWTKFRPSYVLVEVIDSSLDGLEDCPLVGVMRDNGYKIYAKLVHTLFFVDRCNI